MQDRLYDSEGSLGLVLSFFLDQKWMMMNNKVFPAIYDRISAIIQPRQAYLVGGAVRDLLLGSGIHDLDFAVPKQPIQTAKSVADQLNGAFYVLDQERETARVILMADDGQRLMVDFTLFQGQTIEEDLKARDFTITSMAIEVGGDGRVIDPFHGAQDLKDGLLRATTPQSLENDPLRCLRAIRLAAQFGLMISPETKDQIRSNGVKLQGISPERIRDEFFRILAGPKQTAGYQSMGILGLSPYVFFGKIDQKQMGRIRFIEEFWILFLKEHNQDIAANWSQALMVHRLGRFRNDLKAYLNDEIVPERTIYQLSFIAPLLMGETISGMDLKQVLPLSNQEWEILLNSPRAAGKMLEVIREGELPQPLEIYRYFRVYGSAGILGVFMALSEASLVYRQEADQDGWIQILEIIRSYLQGWWEKHDLWIDPPNLLNGDDLQDHFKLNPGPRIGELLESIREAQVEKGITSRSDAIDYLEGVLKGINEPGV